jgi:O-methyltransferase
MIDFLNRAVKAALYRTPFGRFIAHRHQYNFSPRQLCFLASCIDRTRDLNGAIAEVGCFLGHTTTFLNKHMDAEGIEKPYYAMDTFSGFVPSQLEYERDQRRKAPFYTSMRAAFTGNSKTMLDKQLSWNGIRRVRSIQADAAAFDYRTIAPFSFVLIDVDLYIPVLRALEQIVPLMQPGGIVVIDDCASGQFYDGALQAYTEFAAQRRFASDIRHGKLGILEIQ